MINKIVEWFYSRYGINVKKSHVWMFIFLIISVFVLIFSIINTRIDKINRSKGVPIVEEVIVNQ